MGVGLKRLAAQMLAAPPVWRLLRRRALAGDPLTILCYHTLGPDRGGPEAWTVLRMEDFRRQVALLRAHYDIVSLDQALAPRAPGATRPRAVLTFDDGEAGMHRHLLPFVRAEGVPVTVYVATGQIETGTPFWFDRVMNALQAEGAFALDLRAEGLGQWAFPAGGGAALWSVMGPLLERMKTLAPAAREDLAARIAAARPAPPPGRMLAPMTRAELAELAACPLVTIGAHSHCHNLLDQIPLAEARESMVRSRALLRDWTGQEVAHFAYPNGNHSAALCDAARDAGFRSATILGMRLARADAHPFALPRLAIGRYDSAARFRLRLAEV